MASPQNIAELLKAQFSGVIVAEALDGHHPSVQVTPEAWPAVARFLRDDPRIGLNLLRLISALDLHPDPQLEVLYDLLSMRPPDRLDVQMPPAQPRGPWTSGGTFTVRIRVPREGGRVPSVAGIWPTAEWHEREAYDLLGVAFDGHPDLRRILCPDDWAGHPLRKDYEFPTEYHGIPAAAVSADAG